MSTYPCNSQPATSQGAVPPGMDDFKWKWNETKQFRDPVYGYIQVPTPYVKKLVDTSYMQRIKGVAQSGLRPLFAAATHDRFAHSVGVYRFSMLLYDSFSKSAEAALEEQGNLNEELRTRFKNKLLKWRNLLAIAALLHDIGHPIQSHSMEFLYDDVFLHFPDSPYPEGYIQRFDHAEHDWAKHQYDLVREQKISYDKKSPFKESMRKEKAKLNDILKTNPAYRIAINDENFEGNPHERMSAYYILTDPELKQNIDTLCASFEKEFISSAPPREQPERMDELDFICRMITGSRYTVPNNFKDYLADLEYSMRNCVISILNGTIDADSMDYIMRNSFSSGYETSEVDHYRFCSALSVYMEQGQMFLAWKKSALSVIEGFINARNYEPRWLYSHHKVVYQDVLIKEMLIDAVKYMAIHPQTNNGTFGASPEKWLHYPFFTYVLSPFVPFATDKYLFFRSVDGDIENFFKQIALEMKHHRLNGNPTPQESSLIEEYLGLYHESSSRCHKKSLWKSLAEYKKAISAIARRLDTDFDTINRYTLELIQKGLMTKEFHLSTGEGDSPTANHYESEIIYYPRSRTEQQQLAKKRSGVNGLINQYIPRIFKNFDPEHCRIKIVAPRLKNFSKEQVLLGGRHYALSEMLELKENRQPQFPYLFYLPTGDGLEGTDLSDKFFKELEDYCSQRITMTLVGGDMTFHVNSGAYVRDVVHGDIFLPNRFLAVVDTPEFQRLRRIKQLATATQVFPNAGHSRFSHSLGTYHVMTKIVEHFEQLCEGQGMQLFHNSVERDIVLLSALLHDLGHGPYSHAFEHVAGNRKHEDWTSSIILDSQTRLNAVLRELFGQDAPQRIVDCINHRTPQSDNFSFADIYPTLISSQLDADRLDYLMRDSYNTAIQFGNVDLQNLISAMRITVIEQKYSVAIDEAHLSMVEHFLFGRFKMYETVYYNGYKLFSEELLQRIFKRVGALMEHDGSWQAEMERRAAGQALCKMMQGRDLSVSEYLLLDDAAIEAQFAGWLKQNDPVLTRLIQAFLHRNQLSGKGLRRAPLADPKDHMIFHRIRVFHEKNAEVLDLLQQIETILRREGVDLLDPHDRLEDVSHGFIRILRCCKMYYGSAENRTDDKIIWILRENGTVEDIGKMSRMLGDEFHKSYLYYCEDIFWEELQHCNFPEDERASKIQKILNEVRERMKASHPRNMIEIEEKYSCEQQTLEEISSLLKQYIEENANQYDGFYLERQADNEVLEIIEQEDTYFDLPSSALHRANCSLRCRELNSIAGKQYIFTIKRPTESKNFDRNEQFARFEFEMKTDSSALNDDVLRFIQSHLNIPDLLDQDQVSGEELARILKPILTISNRRQKGTIYRFGDDGELTPFKAEICLDSVIYKRSPEDTDKMRKLDWQIELELKSDYLDRVLLKRFTGLLRNHDGLANRLKPESASKYNKARLLLGLPQD